MNILIEQLPEAVEIDGQIYRLDTNFRTGIDIMIMFEDPELTIHEKALIMVQLLYKDIPKDIQRAYELGVKFLNCGEESQEACGGNAVERLYSFEKDAKYIYSAIKQSHGVDLESVTYLHWWKFSYMFLDLKEDCFFTKMIYYRKQKSKGKLSKEEWEYYNSIRDILELPQHYTLEETAAEDEFMKLLNLDK